MARQLWGVQQAGYRLSAPIKIGDSGRSGGTPGRGEGAAWQHAGARGAPRRANLGSLSRKEMPAHRENWKVEAGQSVRPGAGYVFSLSRRVFGGHVAARRRENVVMEVAREIAIYNALLLAAGVA